MERLTDTIPAVFRLITGREVRLPAFSVTSALPSIMNGGKDFSPWSRQDDMLYRTMRIPLETVLGRDGVGLADCAIAESAGSDKLLNLLRIERAVFFVIFGDNRNAGCYRLCAK